jgi:sulfur-carrier protein
LLSLDISYFAWVRERMGRGGETVAVPDKVATIRDLIYWLAARDAAGAAAFAEPARIRVALRGAMAKLDDELSAGDDVSLFPPVTGG